VVVVELAEIFVSSIHADMGQMQKIRTIELDGKTVKLQIVRLIQSSPTCLEW
jgi:hypothetical protein